jgi:hypothetical protein
MFLQLLFIQESRCVERCAMHIYVPSQKCTMTHYLYLLIIIRDVHSVENLANEDQRDMS